MLLYIYVFKYNVYENKSEDFLKQTNQGKLFTANIMSGKRVQYCYRANKGLVMLAGSSKVGRK